jgi:hypothetical protein
MPSNRELQLTVREADTPADLDAFLDAYARVILAEVQAGWPKTRPCALMALALS